MLPPDPASASSPSEAAPITTSRPRFSHRPAALLGLVAISLIGYACWLASAADALDWRWSAGGSDSPPPYLILVGATFGAGLTFLAGVAALRRTHLSRPGIAAGIVVGVVMRAVLIPTTVMLETDHHLYLWDGAVTASGHNPYRHVPDDVLAAMRGQTEGRAGEVPPELIELACQSRGHLEQITFSNLTSMYPPIAQAAFALAHLLSPWSAISWRVVLASCDLVTLLLLLALLRRSGTHPRWALVYWCNPIALLTLFGSAHVDAIVFPFALGAVLLSLCACPVWAAAVLALGVGAKLWPVVLLPLILRPLLRRPRVLMWQLAWFGGVTATMALPAALAGGSDSALFAYVGGWQINDGLFGVIQFLCEWLSRATNAAWMAHPTPPRLVATATLLTGLLAWSWRPIVDGRDLLRRCVASVALMFLLLPVLFPWYYTPLALWLACAPRWSLLAYTPLLALYYLAFELGLNHQIGLFFVVPWLEHTPVLVVLLLELAFRRRNFIDG